MRDGNRNSGRNRRPSGQGSGGERNFPGRKRSGQGGDFRKKREGDFDSSRSKSDDERPARKSFGDKPSYGRGRKPFGNQEGRKPFRKFSGDNKPERNDGERPARKSFGDKPSYGRGRKPFGDQDGRKPFRKFSGENKPERNDAERPGRNYRDAKPFSDRNQSGDTKKSFGRPGSGFSNRRSNPDRSESSSTFTGRGAGAEAKWNRKESHAFYGDKKRRPRSSGKPKISDEPKISDGTTRLNKYISNSGICSRREADELITAGVISVNGEVVTTLGYKVQPGDVVKYNDAKLTSEKPVYLLLNKPKDYITTVDDPQNRQTVMSLIKNACKERVYPVGRLDRNTTGLLLFTNDGDLADKLTHPSFEVQKVYEVHLDKNLKHEHFTEIGNGLMLEDGLIKPDEISYSSDDKSIIGIELHSGRNRIVRRIFEHFGYRVNKLDRVLYAGLTKKDLPRGKYRFLSDIELANLKMMTGKKRFKAAPKRIVLAEE